MKELKFRVWDNESKEMFYSLEENEIYIKITGRVYMGFDGDLFSPCDPIDLIAMQYTGFKDKTGQDIYESDILETPSGTKIIVEDISEFLIFCGRYEEKNGVPLFPSVMVIGNIHESPV